MYADGVESKLRTENSQLLQILNDTRLDLDDATKSRRDLQLRLRDLETRLGVIPVCSWSMIDVERSFQDIV